MKQFLQRSLVFGLVFFILDKGFYYVLYKAPTLEYDQRLEQVLNGKINKEIIVLGSSRGAGNIIAEQLEKETHRSAYNLSYPGSNVMFHEFILKSLLTFNKPPKTILLAVDNPYEFIAEKTLVFRLDRLYPLSNYSYINQELIQQNERNILSWCFCLGRLNTSSFALKHITAPLENPILPCGSMPFISRTKPFEMKYATSVPTYSTKDELAEKLHSFTTIQQMCKDHNIQLVFVFSPNFYTFNTVFEKRFKQIMWPEQKIIVYDHKQPIYKEANSYFDVSHLMKKGATVFTSEISTFINQNL